MKPASQIVLSSVLASLFETMILDFAFGMSWQVVTAYLIGADATANGNMLNRTVASPPPKLNRKKLETRIRRQGTRVSNPSVSEGPLIATA
ncbi:hypothetical protein ACFL2H_08735 [Planctomycetota bacterium]